MIVKRVRGCNNVLVGPKVREQRAFHYKYINVVIAAIVTRMNVYTPPLLQIQVVVHTGNDALWHHLGGGGGLGAFHDMGRDLVVPVFSNDARPVANVAHRYRLLHHVCARSTAPSHSPAGCAEFCHAIQAAARCASAVTRSHPPLRKRQRVCDAVRHGSFPTHLLHCIQGLYKPLDNI